jgi:hypothetical protein
MVYQDQIAQTNDEIPGSYARDRKLMALAMLAAARARDSTMHVDGDERGRGGRGWPHPPRVRYTTRTWRRPWCCRVWRRCGAPGAIGAAMRCS